MSFILDALKKSEIERQRQSSPGLMDTRLAGRRAGLPTWALLLGLLLGINCVVLLVLLLRNGLPGAKPAPATHAQTVDAPAPHFSPLDAAPVYAPEIPVSSTDAAPAAVAAAPTAAPSHLPDARALAQLPHILRRPDPVLSEDPAPENDEVLPSISEVNFAGADALPELHLDVHVYATKPTDRFVYINMRKYHEGSVLQEGPSLERIRRDGVVLNFHGVRFVLPRQS
jgi:general secretion pathway protein B